MYKRIYNLEPGTYNLSRGFTLIELLVVIAVIGVLASVTMVSLSGARSRARDGERVSEIGSIVLAAELYKDACGRYPANITSLTGNTGCPTGVNWGTFIGSSVPIPPDGGNYGYATDGSGSYFLLYDALDTTAAALGDDIDTPSETCADPVYCKGS